MGAGTRRLVDDGPEHVRSAMPAPTSRVRGHHGDARITEARETTMKYIILTYGTQRDYDAMAGLGTGSDLSPDDFAPMHAFMEAFTNDLTDSGELVDNRGISAPVHTRRVQMQDGVPVVTDGPYAETQEVLAGYWIVDCESFDRATAIAARLAECPSPGGIFADSVADVRPLDELSDPPEG
jgi:hypothetical protein